MKTTSCPAKCIYCGQNDATDEFDGLACGCGEFVSTCCWRFAIGGCCAGGAS